ncbi:unnamed protein product [Cyprideis torosa]|uniref:Uncharacterized protein n=1 Tax=Cyprideis torosa TaxID=163714 RepID=A0A7R8ZQB9_9CRUS|nr:unnamed protein product [Cyprideis torosa]CAG0901010.1 unnamed protein product [Cyprideis torosa]
MTEVPNLKSVKCVQSLRPRVKGLYPFEIFVNGDLVYSQFRSGQMPTDSEMEELLFKLRHWKRRYGPGSFEVSLNDVVIWSKLDTGAFPDPKMVLKKIEDELALLKKEVEASGETAVAATVKYDSHSGPTAVISVTKLQPTISTPSVEKIPPALYSSRSKSPSSAPSTAAPRSSSVVEVTATAKAVPPSITGLTPLPPPETTDSEQAESEPEESSAEDISATVLGIRCNLA